MTAPVVGNAIRSSITFRDYEGAAYDPPDVRFYTSSPVKPASQNSPPVETEYIYSTDPSSKIKRTATGAYHIFWRPTEGGTWSRKWVGEGPSEQRSVDEDEIAVRATKVRKG